VLKSECCRARARAELHGRLALGISDQWKVSDHSVRRCPVRHVLSVQRRHYTKAVFNRTVIGDVETANHVRCRAYRVKSQISIFSAISIASSTRCRDTELCSRFWNVRAKAAPCASCQSGGRSAPPSCAAVSACRPWPDQAQCWPPSLAPDGDTAEWSPTRTVTAPSEQESTEHPVGQPQVLIKRLSGLVGQFEPHRSAGLLLANGRAIHRVTTRRHGGPRPHRSCAACCQSPG
jgi:hypothetical protein